MQRQNSGQRPTMLINKFTVTRVKANTPPDIQKVQRATHTAAVMGQIEAALARAAATKAKPAKAVAIDDMHKLDGFPPGADLGAILRARIAKS